MILKLDLYPVNVDVTMKKSKFFYSDLVHLEANINYFTPSEIGHFMRAIFKRESEMKRPKKHTYIECRHGICLDCHKGEKSKYHEKI